MRHSIAAKDLWYIKWKVQNINYLQDLIAHLRFWLLTGVSHRNPLVELIVVRHSVKLTAKHLPKSWRILPTGFCVTCPITLPFPSAVFAPELWSVKKSFVAKTFRNTFNVPYGVRQISNQLLLRVVAFPFCWLNSSSTGPGAVRPCTPLSPGSIHSLWEFTHNHTLSRDTPLRDKCW